MGVPFGGQQLGGAALLLLKSIVPPSASTGLDRVDALTHEPALKDYLMLPSVRDDLLAKLGLHAEVGATFERAAALMSNAQVRAFVLARAAACAREAAMPPTR